MSLSAYLPMGFSCGDDCGQKESEVPLIYESREGRNRGGMDLHFHGMEFDVEFWPVEHPLEPQDEDRPVKCPMPASSVITDGKSQEEKSAESLQKRPEQPEMVSARSGIVGATEAGVRAVRKRHHHSLTRDDHMVKPLTRMPPLPPLPTQNITIFQMLQEFDKFES